MTTMTELQQYLQEKKMDSFITETKIYDKCSKLCIRYPQSLSDFADILEAFLLNVGAHALTIELMGKFENFLVTDYQKKKQMSSPNAKRKADAAGVLRERSPNRANISGGGTSRPTKQQKDSSNKLATAYDIGTKLTESASQQSTDVPTDTFSERTNSGQVVLHHNAALGGRGVFESADRKPLGMRCMLTVDDEDFDNVKDRYRFMFTSLEERARALDKHLLTIQEHMCALACIPVSSLQPLGVPSQETVWVCGRICCDAAEGKINKASIMLEGSRKESGGRRIQLDVSELEAYSLFPGQIVLVEGINSSGRKMIARRIIEGTACAAKTTKVQKMLEYHHSSKYQGGGALSVMVAAGPFTTSANLNYQPLEVLLLRALKEKPDVLVLVGPFVDITQPLLASGDIQLVDDENSGTYNASYEIVFVRKIVADSLKAMFRSEEGFGTIPTNIILVPSLLDAHHEFVFPQPPFGNRDVVKSDLFGDNLGIVDIPYSKDSDPLKRIHLMPNPCMFRINEILFSVCSNDVLFALSSDETSLNIGGNRIARLAQHILQQQSFCPQFPSPPTVTTQMDLRHSKHWEMKVAPDVMILPSRLACLAKDISGTLAVNPGTLAKGSGGGTFAEITIHPIQESVLRETLIKANDASVEMTHQVPERSCVQIVKI